LGGGIPAASPDRSELAAVARHEDVFRLDIAMHDAGAMRGGHTVGDADKKIDDFVPRTAASRRPFAKRSAVDVLGDEIRPSVDLADVVDRQYVRMIERGRRLDFLLKARTRGLEVATTSPQVFHDMIKSDLVASSQHPPPRRCASDDLIRPSLRPT
jgi:hypothetical protein